MARVFRDGRGSDYCAGTRCFSSSNQFSTTLICVGASPSLAAPWGPSFRMRHSPPAVGFQFGYANIRKVLVGRFIDATEGDISPSLSHDPSPSLAPQLDSRLPSDSAWPLLKVITKRKYFSANPRPAFSLPYRTCCVFNVLIPRLFWPYICYGFECRELSQTSFTKEA